MSEVSWPEGGELRLADGPAGGHAQGAPGNDAPPGREVAETVVSPFHCLYQDALEFHTQCHLRLAHSESESSRLSRAAVLLYLAAADALVHQAAAELGQPELAHVVCDPARPLAPLDVWRLLPSVVAEGQPGALDPDAPPWPQFAELLSVRQAWLYPGRAEDRRAYYSRDDGDAAFEPLQPHEVPAGLERMVGGRLALPRTGLPLDPYALRPRHVDTARGILDAAVEALDRRLAGALTRGGRHRREPVRIVYPSNGTRR